MHMESVKNAENIEAMTTPVNYSLHAYSFESKPSPNKEPHMHFCYRWIKNDYHWNVFTAYPGTGIYIGTGWIVIYIYI